MEKQPADYMSKAPTPEDKKKKKTDQKGGNEGTSWMTIIMYIIHVILAVIAVYTAYSCGSGFLGYLAACCCPYIYLPYVFFTDSSMCGVRGRMAAQVARPKAVQTGGRR
jgi:hypothetical protein